MRGNVETDSLTSVVGQFVDGDMPERQLRAELARQ
jgi:hypothetical protein